jgi:hypothetical protein
MKNKSKTENQNTTQTRIDFKYAVYYYFFLPETSQEKALMKLKKNA